MTGFGNKVHTAGSGGGGGVLIMRQQPLVGSNDSGKTSAATMVHNIHGLQSNICYEENLNANVSGSLRW